MKVLALDPGEKVGWAAGDIVTTPDGPRIDDLKHGILKLREAALAVHASAGKYDQIIYETWRLRAKFASEAIGSDFPSVQFVGMIRLSAWTNGVRAIPQSPTKMATARKTLPPDLQDIIDREPKRHDDAHNVSAILHLWFHAWRNFQESQ